MLHEPVLTRNQRIVLDALSDAEAPLSAYGLLERIGGQGIKAPLQVYRALDKLIEHGFVHRVESINAFVACSHRDEHHQQPVAFAICNSCGCVAEFLETSVRRSLEQWSRGHGFKAERVTLELRGLCENCDGATK